MSGARDMIARLDWRLVVILCATLGLAPFLPEPHVWEKLKMLVAGHLTRPIDIFDLVLHGAPWILLILKLSLGMRRPGA